MSDIQGHDANCGVVGMHFHSLDSSRAGPWPIVGPRHQLVTFETCIQDAGCTIRLLDMMPEDDAGRQA